MNKFTQIYLGSFRKQAEAPKPVAPVPAAPEEKKPDFITRFIQAQINKSQAKDVAGTEGKLSQGLAGKPVK
jgi:hypothetical protein